MTASIQDCNLFFYLIQFIFLNVINLLIHLVTTGGTIVMTAGPYCGPPVGSTTVNTVTLDGTATASVNVNDFGPGVRRVQHAQCSQYTPPMPAGTTPIVRQQQTQLNGMLTYTSTL